MLRNIKAWVENMQVGDVFKINFERLGYQASFTCTEVCGFKYYILLGNGLENKMLFEGNSNEEWEKCVSDILLSLKDIEEDYNDKISRIEAI